MEELIKNFLYYAVIGLGSISLICLLIAGLIRSFCFMLDHLKVAKLFRDLLILYIKQKDKSIEEKDIKR